MRLNWVHYNLLSEFAVKKFVPAIYREKILNGTEDGSDYLIDVDKEMSDWLLEYCPYPFVELKLK
jgi:hypothetical protein